MKGNKRWILSFGDGCQNGSVMCVNGDNKKYDKIQKCSKINYENNNELFIPSLFKVNY